MRMRIPIVIIAEGTKKPSVIIMEVQIRNNMDHVRQHNHNESTAGADASVEALKLYATCLSLLSSAC